MNKLILLIILSINISLLNALNYEDCSIYGTCNVKNPVPSSSCTCTFNYSAANNTYVPYVNAINDTDLNNKNLTTSGNISAGKNFIAKLGGAVDNTAGYFAGPTGFITLVGMGALATFDSDISDIVTFIDGTYVINSRGKVFFQDGTNYIIFTDGTNAMDMNGNLTGVNNICLSNGTNCQSNLYYSDNIWIDKNATNGFNFNESKLATIYYNATQSNNISGKIDGGTLSNTQHQDGLYDDKTFNFSEVASSPALDLRMNFTGITTFNQGVIRYKTSSLSGNFPVIQVWNYVHSEWEDYPDLAQSLTFNTITQPVFDPSEHVGTVGLTSGVVQMRLYKSSNGNTNNHYYVDWVAISKGYGTPSGSEIDPYTYHKNESDYRYCYANGTNITGSNCQSFNGLTSYNNIFLTNKTNDINGFGITNVSYLSFQDSTRFGNYSLNFTGSTYLTSANVPETAGTISMWIRPSVTINSASQTGIFMDATTQAKIIMRWYTNNGKLDCYVYDGSFGQTSSTTTSWTAGTWYHIVFTYNSTRTSLYINGNNEANGTGKVPASDSEPVKIGVGYYSTTPLYFNGMIDEFMMFNRSLAPSEVSTLYNSGNGFYGNLTLSPTNSGLVIGYHFDEGAGTSATDYSGNSYTGTLNSQTYVFGKVPNPSGYINTITPYNFTCYNATCTLQGKIVANNLIYNNGSSSDFIKGDGTYDSTAYYKSGDSPTFSTTTTDYLNVNYDGLITGNFNILGALTFASSDPEAFGMKNITKVRFLEIIRKYCTPEYSGAMWHYYDKDTRSYRYFVPSECTFYKQSYDSRIDEIIFKPIETISDGRLCYNNDTKPVFIFNKETGNVDLKQVLNNNYLYNLRNGTFLDKNTGEFYKIVNGIKILINKSEAISLI